MDFQYVELARDAIIDAILEHTRLSPREAEELSLEIVLRIEEYLEEAIREEKT